jgi:hypothetical protein
MRGADFWFPEDKSELDVHRMCTFVARCIVLLGVVRLN